MTALLLGIAGFLLCFLYDINSFTVRSGLLHCTFGMGTVLIAVATALDLRGAWKSGALSGTPDLLLLLLSAACFAALIYCLFFALPFHETYAEQNGMRPVYDRGVYALCRHPGILCFFGRIPVGIPFPDFFDFSQRNKSGDIFFFEFRVLFGSGIEKKIMAVVRIINGFDRSIEIRLYYVA